MALIDLRSDTVTRPTTAMRAAMAGAAVGDDVYGEDPTVLELEARAAALTGMEAALFVPSGTMGNQVAIACHTQPGQEIVVEATSHILNVEVGAMARFWGAMPRAIPGDRGVFTAGQVEQAIRPEAYYLAPTGLICLESTHNAAGGRVWPAESLREIVGLARERGIPVHLDGARIINAQVATGTPARELVAGVDSVMFCLSKGLGCPVGSLLCGSSSFIGEARRVRKALGGGMRQAGIVAAAGLYALDHHVQRLSDDHENACLLASGLTELPGASVWPQETNIVVLELAGTLAAPELCHRLGQQGILASPAAAGADQRRIRFVTHLDVSRSDVLRTVDLISEELRATSA
ncbi:MAG: low-specificity L-threonine aldolase [Candidatus Bipolaricaulota bacterium]